MFGDALKEVAGIFDRRFLMHIFVPSMLFWALLIVVWFVGRGDLSVSLLSWNSQSTLPKTIQIVCFLVWVYLFSSVVSGNLVAIVQFYEGYWDFPLSEYVRKRGTNWHKKNLMDLRAHEADDDAAYEKMYHFYPRPLVGLEDVMPTRLGNIFKSAELYPSSRYKIDSVLIWPRLHRLFPADFIQEVALLRNNLDFMLVIASLSLAFAIVSGVYLFLKGAEWWLFLLCFWGGLIVARISYESALSVALGVGMHIRVAFDLYREELLKRMRIPLPRDQDAEKQVWEEIGKFFYRRGKISSAYLDTSKATGGEGDANE